MSVKFQTKHSFLVNDVATQEHAMILVTGAAGFIGSNVVAELENRKKVPIIVCDEFGDNEKWKNLAKREIYDFVHPENLFSWLSKNKGLSAVIHMGAISSTTEKNVDVLINKNIKFTLNLWNWCSDEKVPFIYASSAATYGSMESNLFDNEKLEALLRLQPLNPYGWSKNVTDIMLMRRVLNGLPTPPQWAGLKFFNVYGPNEYHKGSMMSVVAKFFDTIAQGEVPKLFTSQRPGILNGEQRRDFVYVKDCTNVILWLLDNPKINGIYNVGTGTSRSFNDIVKIICDTINKKSNIEYINMPEEITGKYQYITKAEMGKLHSAGYNYKFHTLEEGIEDFIKNYLSKDDRYR